MISEVRETNICARHMQTASGSGMADRCHCGWMKGGRVALRNICCGTAQSASTIRFALCLNIGLLSGRRVRSSVLSTEVRSPDVKFSATRTWEVEGGKPTSPRFGNCQMGSLTAISNSRSLSPPGGYWSSCWRLMVLKTGSSPDAIMPWTDSCSCLEASLVETMGSAPDCTPSAGRGRS